MSDIYAVSLSASLGRTSTQASASLLVEQEDRKTALRVEWKNLPHTNPGGDPAAWLYWLLGQLVENFDDHDITHARIIGIEGLEVEDLG